MHSPTVAGGYNQMAMPNMEDFEKELAEANRAIEEYVASLPPAEQAAFNQQVDEFAQMFESMSEDEFEKFLGEMFADESMMMMEQNPFEIIDTPAEEVVEVVLSNEDKKKVETAIAILDDIIKQSNLFMVIVNSSSDLPNRINRWTAKGDIPNWQNEANWNSFKIELEGFVQKLYKAEEQDLTTKQYKYLFDLIADEALYNNLIQLQTELKALVTTINIPDFNIQKLSAQSKKAIKNILSKYTESFYLLGVPKAIDVIFEKYLPEAEKIRAAEENATKRALEASKAPRNPAGATSAGSESDSGYGGYDDYSNYYGGGYDPYGYDSNYYGGGYDPYGYDSYGGSDYGSSSGRGGSSGGGRSGGGGGGSRGSRADKAEDDETSDKDKKGKKSKSEQFIPNYEIERAIADIKSSLEDIKAALSDEEGNPTKLANLASHISKDEDVDVILSGATLPTIVDKKITTIVDALKTIDKIIDKKKMSSKDVTHYQKEIKKFFDANKKELEGLRDSINTFEAKTEEEKREAAEYAKANPTAEKSKNIDISTLSKAKQWAYFGGDDALLDDQVAADAKLKESITSRVSLFDIRDNIDTLLKDVNKFATKKVEDPKPKKEKGEFDFPLPPVPTEE